MFKAIPGWEMYEISELGEVYSRKVNRLLSIRINSTGYSFVSFSCEGVQKSFLLHRLLCFVFKDLPSLDSELEVDHKDRDKTNNSLANLKVLSKDDHIKKTLVERGHNSYGQGATRCTCGNIKERRALSCRDCFNLASKKPENIKKLLNPEITAELIEYWVTNFSWVRAAKELDLSDNGLRKRYKTLTGKDPKSLQKV